LLAAPLLPACLPAVSALPCAEQDGFVWVWPGWEEPTLPLPAFSRPPEGYRIHAGAPQAMLCLPACLPGLPARPRQLLAYLC
jgi:phenylpropionate dioxygenase-like ring-hydroxylating dioxygenase large terminal subunit